MSCTASLKGQKMTPFLASSVWKVVPTETLSKTASMATPARRPRSCRGNPASRRSRAISGRRPRGSWPVAPFLRRGEVDDVLEIDGRIMDFGPRGRLHREPVAECLEPPFEHPLGLPFLGGNEPDDVFVQARRRRLGLDVVRTVLIVAFDEAGNGVGGRAHEFVRDECRQGTQKGLHLDVAGGNPARRHTRPSSSPDFQ